VEDNATRPAVRLHVSIAFETFLKHNPNTQKTVLYLLHVTWNDVNTSLQIPRHFASVLLKTQNARNPNRHSVGPDTSFLDPVLDDLRNATPYGRRMCLARLLGSISRIALFPGIDDVPRASSLAPATNPGGPSRHRGCEYFAA
jgi:hypothetical protein